MQLTLFFTFFQNLICEHEIRNIHCACQDADDLSHFAYITKDIEDQGHYCHVFRVTSRVSLLFTLHDSIKEYEENV